MKKLIRIVIKLYALIAAVVMPVGMVYNYSNPWSGDEMAGSVSDGYLIVSVGGSSRGSEILSRTYLMIPTSLKPPSMLKVSITEDARYHASWHPFAFWFITLLAVYGWYLIIVFTREKWPSRYGERP